MSERLKKLLVIVAASIGATVLVAEEAAAVVGRPLTPVSVAGVARRSARRN
jgi:hypothetical protein